jgi:4-diphosphocytidyl-2-C-methyl-D-erythritol kinase
MIVVLVKPDIHISTADAYANVTPKQGRTPLQEILLNPVEEWKNLLVNDFEESIFRNYPQIEHIKQALYDCGAVYASMSGSGSAVFGIFTEKPDIETTFDGCFIWEGEM